jgi:hypothetical protein
VAIRGPAGLSVPRSRITWFCTPTRADGGASAPHIASASSSTDTTRLARSSNAASTARCPPRGTASAVPPQRTVNGPSKQNSVRAAIAHHRTRNPRPPVMIKC